MFFLHNLERRVTLHPSYFGRNMHELVTTKLVKDVEGTCAGDYYIIAIMDAFDVSEGRILPGNGLAEFTVKYRAVVWRPFKGEVVRYSEDSRWCSLRSDGLTRSPNRWMRLSFPSILTASSAKLARSPSSFHLTYDDAYGLFKYAHRMPSNFDR